MGNSFDVILQIDLWSSFPDLLANWRCRETGCLQERKLRMPIIEGRHDALVQDVCLGIFQSGLDEICCKVGGSYKEFSRIYIASWHDFFYIASWHEFWQFSHTAWLGSQP